MNVYECPVCQAAFFAWPSSGQTFCSQQCVGVARRTTATVDTIGRRIALETYPDEQPCEVCGKTGKGRGVIDRHHRNSDRSDNSAANIAFLCRKHHLAAHRESDGKVGGGARPRIVALNRDRAIDQAREAAPYFRSGWTTARIAETLGVHPETVRRWTRKYPEVFR